MTATTINTERRLAGRSIILRALLLSVPGNPPPRKAMRIGMWRKNTIFFIMEMADIRLVYPLRHCHRHPQQHRRRHANMMTNCYIDCAEDRMSFCFLFFADCLWGSL